LRYIPKVGPFKGLAFNNPTSKTEDLYIKSINTTVDQYRAFLHQARTETLALPNVDLDSGQTTKATEYSLTDEAYAKLLAQVAGRKFDLTTPELRDNILDFYSHLTLPIETKKNPGERQNVLTGLHELKSMIPVVSGRQISARSRSSNGTKDGGKNSGKQRMDGQKT